MKKDWKAHPVSNGITFAGILLSLFMISYCMLFGERYRSFDEKQKEAYRLNVNIQTVEQDLTEDQAINILQGFGGLVRDHSLTYAVIEDLGEQKILTFHDREPGMDQITQKDAKHVCTLINTGALCFVMHDNKPLQDVYRELTELCSQQGMEIFINDHKERNERKTVVVEKMLYVSIRAASIIFSTLFLLFSIYLWFDLRKHEWFIRNICGQSVKELLLESVKIFLIFIGLAYLVAVLSLSIPKPTSAFHIMQYGFLGVAEAVVCVGVLSFKYSNVKR